MTDKHPVTRTRYWLVTHSRTAAWMVGAAAILLLAWGAHWVYERFHHVYLDDARIDGEVVTISSRVSGWITQLPVIEGDTVKKGQLLAKVDDRDMVLQREVLVARLKAMENQGGVVQAQTGQVDQETLGKYESESNRLKAAEAEVASQMVRPSRSAGIQLPFGTRTPEVVPFQVNTVSRLRLACFRSGSAP